MATSLHGWQLKPISLSPLACLLAWRVPTGSQRIPKGLQKGTPKWPKIDQKSTRAALGMPKDVRGYPPKVPPRLPTYIFMHIYAYFAHIYAYLCIFCAYLCMFSLVLCIFIHIVVHVIHFCAYLCIFMHVYECVCIFGTYLYTSVFFTHVCTYSHISIHEKTLICCQWKIMQPGYTPQGIKYLQVRSI